jgi:RNA polymerase sigma factor (sigma-70 family)
MHEDAELLRRYAADRSEPAFTELIQRHVDLVYSAALRLANGDVPRAQDVTQQVFSELARQAQRLQKHPALAGWLYTTTRLIALRGVRTEQRRKAREQEAAVMNEILREPAREPDWEQFRPVLDDAMHGLGEKDRLAILLRYFKNKSLKEVGGELGLSENAARMRVERALEKLRVQLARKGVTSTAAVLALALTGNAVTAAPSAFVTTLANATLAGVALPTAATLTAAKTIAMTTLQKTLITAALAATVGTGVYEAREISRRQTHIDTLERQQASMTGQIEQLNREREDSRIRQDALQQDNEQLRQTAAEVPKLRGEVTRLRAIEKQLGQLKATAQDTNDPFAQSVQNLTARAAELNECLERMPDKKIPELQFLKENDWLDVAGEAKLDSDADIRKALSKLRSLAKHRFANLFCHALDEYLKASDGQLPSDVSQLKSCFEVPVDDAILQRYRMLQTGYVTNLPPGTEWVISEKAPVDRDYDSHMYFGPKGRSGSWGTGKGSRGDPDETWATREQP